MAKEYDVIIERDSEGYFVATVPALKETAHIVREELP